MQAVAVPQGYANGCIGERLWGLKARTDAGCDYAVRLCKRLHWREIWGLKARTDAGCDYAVRLCKQPHRGIKICKCALSLPACQGEESPSNTEHRTS